MSSDTAKRTSLDNTESLSTTGDAKESRWEWQDIDSSLWDQYFPYQLAILKSEQSVGLSQSDIFAETAEVEGPGVPTYSIYKDLVFTLPINPENLTNATPFAISPQATQGGVVEQHGGVPFRQIMFSGTFGVLTQRERAATAGGLLAGLGNENFLGGVFAGTLSTLSNTIDSAVSITTAMGLGASYTANIIEGDPGEATGYYQFRLLGQFLESYAEMKKTSEGKNLRLALIIWKEEAAYLVSPMRYEVLRQAQSGYEYRYTLQFQAWRRIPSASLSAGGAFGGAGFLGGVLGRGPSVLGRVLNTINQGQRLVNGAINTIGAVRRDFAKVLTVFRQGALLVKAISNVPKVIADFPASMRATWVASTTVSWDIIQSSFNGKDSQTAAQAAQVASEVKLVKSGVLQSSPTLEKLLSDDRAFAFQSLIPIDSLGLNSLQRAAVQAEIDQTLKLTSRDFKTARDFLLDFAAGYSDEVGLSNADYDLSLGRSALTQKRKATSDDFRALHGIALVAGAFSTLTLGTPQSKSVSTIEYVAGLGARNGIAIRVPRSKFAVPFPYESSLEKLAQQYLGDASRWIEIAELNELRAPYVDEIGTSQPLVVNGSGSSVVVADGSVLRLGQSVTLSSGHFVPQRRRIVSIDERNPRHWVVTLNGEGTLGALKTADGANISYFQPGTVNSQQVIYIPSDSAADEDVIRYVPTADDFDRILDSADVDGLLTEQNDLVITSDGDWPFVAGLGSLVQWARVALNTTAGAMPLHPSFGLEVGIGRSTADSTPKDVLASVRSVFRYNPSFTGVQSAVLQRYGSVVQLGLELGVKGSDSKLPISFTVG